MDSDKDPIEGDGDSGDGDGDTGNGDGDSGDGDRGDDAASSDAGLPGPDPTFSGDTVCTSGEQWLRGDHESPRMHPGRACITCHTEEREGPRFQIAGTVYATGHEPDDCVSADGSDELRVEITDAEGNLLALEPNGSGNFFSEESVAFPISARVIQGDRARAMLGKVSTGDCNSCHTEDGRESAPGRIALPLP